MSRLNKVLRNPVCARSIFADLNAFRPVLKDILQPKEIPSNESTSDDADRNEPELLFNVKINCLENYLHAVPKENEQNCVTLAKKEFETFESCSLIQEEGKKLQDLVLCYLYSTRSDESWLSALLSDTHVTAMHNAASIDMINKAIKGLGMVLSPLSTSKMDFEGFHPILSAVEVSYAYAFLRSMLSGKVPGGDRGSKFQMALMDGLKTTRGVLIYQAVFVLQNKLIHSESYYKDESFMVISVST
ncbi:uncharacterized protein BXIN_1001 [Babesia sp. Xinjiang]|uniref:uncharacterized protein n=1 Tax=Babesia sp. Xinjiang TaxID=462227 RepID=UPI000A2445E6|nr:uncharacterized protein BXIN_1001 [Babesia sp. Xinjiang]ORM42216.1 hypothetical protein BXIN_1001 [Babesia sp. Xinjiang]